MVPPALLDARWLGNEKIVVLEPRRLAARAAAAWMARQRNEQVGDTVGYRVRRDTRVGRNTRIEVVTEGVLTRMLQDDPTLDGVGLVIFDEFHERSLVGDTGLALTLATQELLRPELRILVMSATLDGAAVTALMPGSRAIRSSGRMHPVATHHRAAPSGVRVDHHVARVVREVLEAEAGSVLVFLAGAGDIKRVAEHLAGAVPPDVDVHQLFGAMPSELQDAAIAPAPRGRRKVVLATNVAETSLTIDGVSVVVDSGMMRVPRFSPRTGMTRLETVRVSRASADQRRGRAGRLGPGACYRCWSAAEDAGLVPFTRAEILDADLAGLALDLAVAGFASADELRWLDPPPRASMAQARALLALLGALDGDGRITDHGRAMARIGAHPRLAHMMVRATSMGRASVARATAIVGLLDDRDPLRSDVGVAPSDIALRLDAIESRSGDRMPGTTLDRGLVARAREAAAEWQRRLSVSGNDDEASDAGTLLALAYPDRVAQRRGAPGRFLLRNGRGATLPVHDALAHVAWIVAAELDDSGADARIALAAELDPEHLLRYAAEQVTVEDEVYWDDETGAVKARRRTRLGALTLSEQVITQPDPVQVRREFINGIRVRGIAALPWSKHATSVRQRIAFCATLEAGWPDVSDEALAETLEAWLGGRLAHARRMTDLERADLADALMDLLGWEQRRALDELAPERIVVPTGSAIAVDYADASAPVLAVRLQEVFGMASTPRIGRGRVPVLMHLLSPGYRPVQVTRDLESFWKTGYFDVRRDMRGRYPKHHWPDDPTTATAVRGRKR